MPEVQILPPRPSERSSNGRTAGLGPANVGSSPALSARKENMTKEERKVKQLVDYVQKEGRKIGAPECCINFFITKWLGFYLNGQKIKMQNHTAKIQKAFGCIPYIACPKCIARKMK